MPISSKRYKFLDKETNVSISDFLNGNNLGTLNIPGLNLKDFSSKITNFLGSTFQNADGGIFSTLQDSVKNLTDRLTKGSGLDLKDLSKFKLNDISKITEKVFGGNLTASSIFNKLPDKYKDMLGSRFNIGSEKQLGVKESGGIFAKALNTILPQSLHLSPPTSDRNDSLSSITALTSIGSELGVKNVFKNLSQHLSLDDGLLSKASGIISNELINKKDFNGVFDIFKDGGYFSKLSNPNIINSITNNFKIPEDAKKNNILNFGDTALLSLRNIDENWDKSDSNNSMLSTAKLSANKDFKTVIDSVIKNKLPTINDLNLPPTDDIIFLRSAMK